tara:strand:+ start:1868 stop:2452 length:585 start_codon:yes stop_codon:yes gene_type:complete
MKKTILTLTAILVTLNGTLTVTAKDNRNQNNVPARYTSSLDQREARAIEAVLRMDQRLSMNAGLHNLNKENGPKTNQEMDALAKKIADYVKRAKAHDFSSCPKDFTLAYNTHLNSWRRQGMNIANHPHILGVADHVWEGFLGGMLGVSPTLNNRIRQITWNNWVNKLKKEDAEIIRTWEKLETIALQHGANLGN